MMGVSPNSHELLEAAWKKAERAAALYLHSAGKLNAFDATRPWTPDELEPYDALVTRFERLIEVLLKFFRVVEIFETASTGSTVRDCLALMAKLGLVEDVDIWMEMREVRNRIAHDYLPEKVSTIYSLLLDAYRPIIVTTVTRAREYVEASRRR
jgi:hypothetical protein